MRSYKNVNPLQDVVVLVLAKSILLPSVCLNGAAFHNLHWRNSSRVLGSGFEVLYLRWTMADTWVLMSYSSKKSESCKWVPVQVALRTQETGLLFPDFSGVWCLGTWAHSMYQTTPAGEDSSMTHNSHQHQHHIRHQQSEKLVTEIPVQIDNLPPSGCNYKIKLG